MKFSAAKYYTEGLALGTRVTADKGFFSATNKAGLKERRLKNGLMYKAFRNTPLTRRMKRFNRLVSRMRWRFSFTKASYFTTEKVDAQFAMKALCLTSSKPLIRSH